MKRYSALILFVALTISLTSCNLMYANLEVREIKNNAQKSALSHINEKYNLNFTSKNISDVYAETSGGHYNLDIYVPVFAYWIFVTFKEGFHVIISSGKTYDDREIPKLKEDIIKAFIEERKNW